MELGPNQEKWLQALESGEYKQGKKKLRVEDRFCCLGVACEISGMVERVITYKPSKGIFQGAQIYSYDGNAAGLPDSVTEWLGLYDSLGYPKPEYRSLMSLYEINDNGAPFSTIVETIRANSEAYFMESK